MSQQTKSNQKPPRQTETDQSMSLPTKSNPSWSETLQLKERNVDRRNLNPPTWARAFFNPSRMAVSSAILLVCLTFLGPLSKAHGSFRTEPNSASQPRATAKNSQELRQQAEKLIRDGNWAEAYDKFKTLLLEPEEQGQEVRNDLQNAIRCLSNLGRISEADELLEGTVEAQSENAWALRGVADQYIALDPNGFKISGEFERGPHRGGGKPMNSALRDRVRALQLMVKAMPLFDQLDDKQAVGEFYFNLASQLLYNRGYYQAWRLQSLTDLSELPDYEENYAYYYYQAPKGAPVDENGDPIYHDLAESWEAATSDGERWRYCLMMAQEVDPRRRNEVISARATFARNQFGVTTMAQYGRMFASQSSDDDENESGRYALHTLGDNETIAKLANGVKRFELREDYNFIKLYEQILAEPRSGQAHEAINALAQIYEDRRQYPKAAETWKKSIEEFGDTTEWKKQRLDQIIGNWGRFEPTQMKPANSDTSLEYRFRNGKHVEFTAQKIDLDRLLKDVKAYVRSEPKQLDWQRLNIQTFGYQYLRMYQAKYAIGDPITWDQDLTPAKNHFDKRVTVKTPVKKAGAYLVTARMDDGNQSNTLLWLADTSLVRVSLNNESLYFVADAETGEPLEGVNVEFFGYRQEPIRENNRFTGRYKIQTTNFAEKSDKNGLIRPSRKDEDNKYTYLIMARGDEERFAFIGFVGVWFGNYYDQYYNATKTIVITDRPVYRPGHKVQVKLWVRHAQYDQDSNSQFAGREFDVLIRDPMGNEVHKQSVTADEFGGVNFDWQLTEEAKLGVYNISTTLNGNTGGSSFRVEEYKKPEYEVTIDAPKEPVALGESIPVTINAKYYFGGPVTQATVKYTVTRTKHTQSWYPYRYWDWCYGPGYWWFAYDYEWYPGFNRWVGCMAPHPWWWYGNNEPPELVMEQEVPIGPGGTLSFDIDSSFAKEMHGDSDHKYSITAEVRDQSRRTIIGSGEVLVARKPFKIFTWVNRGYYQVGDTIEANFLAQTLDRQGVEGKGELTLFKVTYDSDMKPIETPVRKWDLNTDDQGKADQQIAASAKGQYRLSYKVTDANDHTIEGGYVLTIIGDGFDGRDYRFNNIELIPNKGEYAPGETVSLQINSNRENATVLLFVRPSNGVYLPPKVIKLDGKSTIEEIKVSKKDMPNFFVEAITVFDGHVHSDVKEIIVPPEQRVINVEVLPNQEEYKPGEKAKVKVRLTDITGENYQGSTVISIYDKSVEYISGGSNVPEIREFFWKWRRNHRSQKVTNLGRYIAGLYPNNKFNMQNLGAFGATVADDVEASGELEGMSGPGGAVERSSRALASESAFAADAAAAPAMAGGGGGAFGGRAMMAKEANVAGSGSGNEMVEPTVRTQFADTALWVGTLNTDPNGIAEVELDMPENLTTWKVRVWAMGHGTKVGSGDAEVITRKDLLVRMQAPRFFVQKDEVMLSAIVHNYLATDKEVQVRLELDGQELVCLDEPETTVTVPADGEARVNWMVRADREGTATVRMFALSDEESDAMEMKFPVYIHGMLKQEAWAGTVRPDAANSLVKFTVPLERQPEQSRLEVRYSPSLAGAMVDALPYLTDYPYGCTEQTLNRWLPTVITQQVLIEMGLDLAAIKEKRTNLNAQEIGDDQARAQQWQMQRKTEDGVFDREEVDRRVQEGLKALYEMQNSDGGWGWFSGYGESSFAHTTAVVVHGLQIAQSNDVALVPGVLDRGIEWMAQYQARELQKLKNAEEKIKPYKLQADDLDALLYMVLTDADRESAEMREFLYRDRNGLSVYSKAMFGFALTNTDDEEKVAMIRRNLDQYLVQDEENETAYLKLPENSYWWYWYGSDIEANAYYLKLLTKVDPEGVTAPRLVKYLLNNRKHATYWNSTRDTALVVEAFADYIKASGENRPDMTVEVWLDGEKKKEVQINAENFFSFDNKFVLEGEAIEAGEHTVEIRRTGDGPVYFNVYATNFTTEDFITKAGLEVKVARKYYKLTPVDADTEVQGSRGQVVNQNVQKYERTELNNLDEVVSGDLVEVELTIESKNDYEYLLFEDMKPAGFEPVELQSGYNGNELRAYVEYRDERVSFFVRQLARGTHSVSYRLFAEVPGKFSALPAKASAMYAPELKGNSDELKLQVVDDSDE